jgi:phosphoribosylglycinamide formyltransferase-1
MRVLAPEYVSRFAVMNTHPALLPLFPGAHAVRDALAAGATETGTTVHWVDAGVDTGPIIAQRRVAIESADTERISPRTH